jgi:hypothetical protein
MTVDFAYDPVTAMDEATATGETAVLFAEIRQTMRIPTHIQFPATHHSLEDGRAVHGLAEQFQLRIGGCRHRGWPGRQAGLPALSISGISPTATAKPEWCKGAASCGGCRRGQIDHHLDGRL